MNFLYPGFLWALTALSIPIIIHLFYFRRYQRVYFSNVRFLREIKEETATRNRLKHWLVLLTRLLALTALVLAFAQPYLPDENATEQRASRQVSIFVDNSFSMDALGEDRSLFEQARDRARAIAEAYGPDDRFQLLSADLTGSQQRLLDQEAFLAALDELDLSPKTPTLEQVHERQRDALSRAEPGAAVAYLLSDFQRSIADFTPDTALAVNLVPLQGTEQRNLSLDSAWFEEPVQVRGQRASLNVRIRNYGSKDAEKTSVRLLFGEEVKALGEIDVPAGESVTDTLAFSIPEQGWPLGRVEINDYPVTFDDTWYFSFPVAGDVPVLVLGRPEGNPFLNTLFGNNALFRLENRPADNVDYAALGNNRLVVLDGLERLPSGLVAALNDFLENGGAVLVFPGESADASTYNSLLNSGGASLGERVTRTREVGSFNMENPIFRDVFASVPRNLALPAARLSYRLASGAMSREDNLMRFKDGDSFLGRFPVGRGSLYVCASPLTSAASDLPAQGGLFVPFVFRLAVVGSGDRPLAQIIGRDEWIDLGAVVQPALLSADQQPSVRLQDRLEFLPRVERSGDRIRIQVADQATEAGHYQIVMPDGAEAGHFSMNYDRRESQLEFWSRKELDERFSGSNTRVLTDDAGRLSADVSRISDGRRLWKACLIFALAFLGLEVLLLRWL